MGRPERGRNRLRGLPEDRGKVVHAPVPGRDDEVVTMQAYDVIETEAGDFAVTDREGRVVMDGPVIARFATADEASRFSAASRQSDEDRLGT